MSTVPVTNSAAIAAAAAKKRAEEKEELELTRYNKDDLDGWEFKIVRSVTGAFRKYENVEKVCAEEAKAGWEMVEKFDDNRIRFKRSTDNRAGDRNRQIDPYRINYGMSPGSFGMTIVGVIFFIVGIAIFLALYFKH